MNILIRIFSDKKKNKSKDLSEDATQDSKTNSVESVDLEDAKQLPPKVGDQKKKQKVDMCCNTKATIPLEMNLRLIGKANVGLAEKEEGRSSKNYTSEDCGLFVE